MNTRVLAIILIGLLLSLAFLGCAAPDEGEGPTPTPGEEASADDIPMPEDTGGEDDIPELPI